MATLFDILAGGQSAKDFGADLLALEVEEHADLPGAFTLVLPVALHGDDYDTVSDPRLAPLANICVTAQAADGLTHCLMDGYVLAQEIHLETGTAGSTIKIHGQDASWLMNTTERAKQWVDVTDGAVANAIFGDYGFTPGPANLDDDSGAYAQNAATLMQRATDAQFLRRLAKRAGKWFRVVCTDTPGRRTGIFAAPDLNAAPVLTLILNGAAANIAALDIAFDVMRPAAVDAFQALVADPKGDDTGAGGQFSDTGLANLSARGLAELSGANIVTALLTTTGADGGTITQRATALLREAGWFVRAEGRTNADLLGAILRVGTLVCVQAAGALHSGTYLVWSVRHSLTAQAHEMNFTLMRNAIGTAPAPGAGP